MPRNTPALLEWARAHERDTIALIREMVEIESPSDDAPALARFAKWFRGRAESFGARVKNTRENLVCTFDLPSRKRTAGQLLVLSHYDTVWPVGTLRVMPYRERDGRLWGPGVLDMKAGIALFLTAVRGLRELAIPVAARLVLQVNADEETGSHTSRGLTEKNAAASRAVFVVEPGTGLEGKLKTARKGVGDYHLTVSGIASHAGVDFGAGASAVLELSRQLLAISAFTNLERGITVNPGVISGGTRSNVIAAEAQSHIDIRIARLRDAAGLDRRFRTLKPFDARCSVNVAGGLNRPPMERTPPIAKLFRLAQSLAREMNLEIQESSTGGGSDGNFTAALGIPTLDGLGAVGEGAHAGNESILVNRIADRTALLGSLLASGSAGNDSR